MLFDEFSFLPHGTREVEVQGKKVRLAGCQILVGITIVDWADYLPDAQRDKLPENAPRLPAILDTGNSSTLCIRESQLEVFETVLSKKRFIREKPQLCRDGSGNVHLVPRIEADLWVHATKPVSEERVSYRIGIGRYGIAVYTNGKPEIGTHFNEKSWRDFVSQRLADGGTIPELRSVRGPHLPILGLAAMCQGGIGAELKCSVSEITVKLFVK